jgi:hypothetical protein
MYDFHPIVWLIIGGTVTRLLSSFWDSVFAKNKKIKDAVSKTAMELFVKEAMREVLAEVKKDIDDIREDCKLNRDTCVGKQWGPSVNELKADIRSLHKKIDELTLKFVTPTGAGK